VEKEKLLEVRNVLEDIKTKGTNKKYIIELDRLINDNDIPLKFSTLNNNAAAFNPNYKVINVNLDRLHSWLDEMMEYYQKNYYITDVELFKAYLTLYVYAHEIEHTNQFAYAFLDKEPKYAFKKQVCQDIFNLMIPKKHLLPRPITLSKEIYRFVLYKKNAYNYILERNASIEGFDLASKVAYYSDEKDIMKPLIDSRNVNVLQGYLNDSYGCLYETYKGLKMMKEYRKLDIPDDLILTDKAREGLSLRPKEKELIVNSIKNTLNR